MALSDHMLVSRRGYLMAGPSRQIMRAAGAAAAASPDRIAKRRFDDLLKRHGIDVATDLVSA